LEKVRLGFVPLHRYPFDEAWAQELKKRFIDVIASRFGNVVELVHPGEGDTKLGLVTDDSNAERVVELFKSRSVNGLALATLTFGDELAGARVAEEFKGSHNKQASGVQWGIQALHSQGESARRGRAVQRELGVGRGGGLRQSV